MACAFGMEACKQRYKTKYIRLPDLLLELDMARSDGTYKKVQAKYANPVLLIIDEWLLMKPTETEQHDILELLHRRERNPQRFSAHSMTQVAGMTSSVVMTVPLQKQSLIVSSMMRTKSILFLRIQPTTAL